MSHAIMVVDSKQLAVGVTALPLPLSSNSEDFLWFGTQFLSRSTVAPATAGEQNSDVLVVDSKAMRKITLNQVLVMVSEMVQLDAGVGASVDFAINFRMLLKK